jgi:lysophospholipase L1-like esterase
MLFVLLSLLIANLFTSVAQEAPRPRKIAVFGSSVAHGSVDHEDKGGYAGRLGALLKPRGWDFVNVSRGGDSTIKIAPRFETDLLPQHAGYVVIALSLSNEGIAKQADKAYRDGIYEQWRTGVLELIRRCREAGMIVAVANCYARSSFADDSQLYEYTRRMDVEISKWDVPSINLLGAIDDGRGAWVEGFYADGGHPNGSGHQEMCYAIVPSLFEALEAGKPIPAKDTTKKFAHVAGGANASAALAFMPADTVHSFAVSFWVRPKSNGALAAVSGKLASLRAEPWVRDGKTTQVMHVEAGQEAIAATLAFRDGKLVYAGPGGEAASGAIAVDDVWHHVAVSHGCARGLTQLYVDGALMGEVSERLIPDSFYLGGGAAPTGVAESDVKEWCVYRSALNEDSVRFIHDGGVFQSSLEVYAPLTDATFAEGGEVENRAQSMSQVKVTGKGIAAKER